MNRLIASIPLLIGVVLLGVCTLIQARISGRWNTDKPAILLQFTERYAEIPAEFGDWTSEETELSSRELKAAGGHAYVSRTYRNAKTSQRVSVFMICGYTRNIAVHTPQDCWVSAGFRQTKEVRKRELTLPRNDAELFECDFRKATDAGPNNIRVFWSWNADEKWEISKNPRIAFGARTPLNKIYLMRRLPVANDRSEDNSELLEEFAADFLPRVNEILFRTDPPAEESAESGLELASGEA